MAPQREPKQGNQETSAAPHLAADEAAKELGISLPTLYAYVSRGLIRSEAIGGSRRSRRYRADDVRVLKQRRELRRNPAKAIAGALHWGEPVMESAITLIANGHVYYRGQDAVALAMSRTVEEVAALIWTGDFGSAEKLFAGQPSLSRRYLTIRKHLSELPTPETFQVLLPLAAADDVSACDLRPAAVVQTGARILRLLCSVAIGTHSDGKGLARTLQEGWAPVKPKAAQLINAALILCADHELNVSSFTARCVASAGSTPYGVVTGGLAALEGVKHGKATERVEAFLHEARTPAGVSQAMISRLRRGEKIPGFGHPLYPEGDPRGKVLLELVATMFPKSPVVAMAAAATEEAFKLMGERPTIDFGLVILARGLSLPPGGALTLFAIGRTIGWIGHAIEQYQKDRIIRPRARYIGELPATVSE
jgi:citrate synthase